MLTKGERNELICARHESGYSQEEIGKFYKLSQSRVSAIIIAKRKGLAEPIEETRGAKPRLNESDLTKLSELMKEKESEKTEEFSHWNKWSVQQLIKEHFGVDYHANYIWKIMKQIGFTSQRPQKKDYRQDKEKVRIFKTQEAVAIKKIQ